MLTWPARETTKYILAVARGAGVVFGDIGTSPLYAFKACFASEYGLAPAPNVVAGLLSLIVWTLTITVSVKYIAVIMRADNEGKGGILALLALVLPREGEGGAHEPPPTAARTSGFKHLALLGLFGAAQLYGDGVITPAISVLSAVERTRSASRSRHTTRGSSQRSPVSASWSHPPSSRCSIALRSPRSSRRRTGA